jgi:hypothetical protein
MLWVKFYEPAQVTTEESVRGTIAPKFEDKILHLMNLLVMVSVRGTVLIKQPMSLGDALFLSLTFVGRSLGRAK